MPLTTQYRTSSRGPTAGPGALPRAVTTDRDCGRGAPIPTCTRWACAPVVAPAKADPGKRDPSPRAGLVCLGLTHSLMIAYPAPNSIAAVTVV
jgi:hypothetical protein